MRSTDAAAYQDIPQPVAVMAKTFDSSRTGRHVHKRGQVLYATSGLMLAYTDAGDWTVPTGHALLIPPGLPHDIAMHGRVHMLTAYIAPARWKRVASSACRVIRVSRLLDAALEAIYSEPEPQAARGHRLASVILDEVKRAEIAEFTLPLPTSGKLRALCAELIAAPGLAGDLDAWSDAAAVSRRTLTRRFREETGLSLGQWRRRLRLLHSMKLKAEGVADKDVAARMGYGSTQALNAMIARADTRASYA